MSESEREFDFDVDFGNLLAVIPSPSPPLQLLRTPPQLSSPGTPVTPGSAAAVGVGTSNLQTPAAVTAGVGTPPTTTTSPPATAGIGTSTRSVAQARLREAARRRREAAGKRAASTSRPPVGTSPDGDDDPSSSDESVASRGYRSDPGTSRTPGSRRRPIRLDQPGMQRQLREILRNQRNTAAGRRIAGITTTNTITTTYKDGSRPSVTRNSTRVRN